MAIAVVAIAMLALAGEASARTVAKRPRSVLNVRPADLSVSISSRVEGSLPHGVTLSSMITFTVTVHNHGPGPSWADLDVAAPPGDRSALALSGVEGCSVGDPWNAWRSTGHATCQLGVIQAGESRTITLQTVVFTKGLGTSPISVTATVSSMHPASPDPNLANNTATDTVQQEKSADVTVSITPAPGNDLHPIAGAEQLWIRVSNAGPGFATGVTLSGGPQPSGLTATIRDTGCATTWISCNLGTISPRSVETLIVSALVSATGTPGSTIPLTVTVSGDGPDPVPGNNSFTRQIPVGQPSGSTTPGATAPGPPPRMANLVVRNTANRTTVGPGQQVAYTMSVTNRGPHPATGVVLNGVSNQRLGAVRVRTSRGGCRPAATPQMLTARSCSIGRLASGQTATVTLRGTPRAAGPVRLTATATSPATADPQPGNNQAVATARRVGANARPPQPMLSIGSPQSTFRNGRRTPLRIGLRNVGHVPLSQVQVCVRLPRGLVRVGSTPRTQLTSGEHCFRLARLRPVQTRQLRLVTRGVCTPTGAAPQAVRVTATGFSRNGAPRPARASIRLARTGPRCSPIRR